MMTAEEEYLTYDEAAERYHVGETTIRRWVREGYIKRYKKPVDRKAYVRVSDIEAMRNIEPKPFEPKEPQP